MVLSDAEVRQALAEGEAEIEPFDEECLTPNGYDLRVESLLVPGARTDARGGGARVPPLSWFVVSTRERVRLGAGLAAQLWLRSSFARKGIMASFGKVDAGFNGTLTISAFNASRSEVEIPLGARFCQIVLERLGRPAERAYAERSGNFQGQRGITLEPPARPAEGGGPCRRHACSACCEGTEMPLTEGDVLRVRKLGFERDGFIEERGGWLRLRNAPDGRCTFLKEGLCSIHPQRPEGCVLYPVVWEAVSRRAMLDPECPHRRDFSLARADEKRVARLVDRLLRERRARGRRAGRRSS